MPPSPRGPPGVDRRCRVPRSRRDDRSGRCFVSRPGRQEPLPPAARPRLEPCTRPPSCPLCFGSSAVIRLCEPSHGGGLALRLPRQKKDLPSFSAVNPCGSKTVPRCEPSQNGCFLDRPQLHHQRVSPAVSSNAMGLVSAISGLLIDRFLPAVIRNNERRRSLPSRHSRLRGHLRKTAGDAHAHRPAP
jgi:hypothetical protein